jgi:redox-sensitive bicupin YhaK (pirin superfamily)
MSEPILQAWELGFQWPTLDPFLFCVHHHDAYPAGDDRMAPKASLEGRRLGQDFEGKDGWRMYHGSTVPGFPRHPHRGFETVTLARRGYIDHSDSLGATARFGHGDVQWMTAGRGIVHCEMFPLVNRDQPNPTELFQLWLNLPAEDKLVEPHFTMLWDHTIPRATFPDDAGHLTEVAVIAGTMDGVTAPTPPPHSWASRPDARVHIYTIKMAPHASWTLPADVEGLNRVLYFFEGDQLRLAGGDLSGSVGVQLRSEVAVLLENGPAPAELLLLQGKPIGEPIARHGPFVMNQSAEIIQAFSDYQRTGFGGWPWDKDDPTHPRSAERFAIHADGTRETPDTPSAS